MRQIYQAVFEIYAKRAGKEYLVKSLLKYKDNDTLRNNSLIFEVFNDCLMLKLANSAIHNIFLVDH